MSPLEYDSVGILLGSPVIHKIISGKPTYEKAELYFECGHRIGMARSCSIWKGLDLAKEQVSGYVWSPTSKRYLRTVQPSPPVIHKRILSSSPKLTPSPGNWGKDYLILRSTATNCGYMGCSDKTPVFNPICPKPGKGIDGDPVPEMLQKYPAIFIKPVVGSLGHSILKIEATGDGRYLLQSHQR